MKRGTPLRRKTRMRSKRLERRRSLRERDLDYMLLVKTMPCAARGVPGHTCDGRIEADHAGERPMGRKADDRTVIPLCQLGHAERTGFAGPFRTWDRARMRAWLDGEIAKTQSFRELMARRKAQREQQERDEASPAPLPVARVHRTGGRRA